MHSWIQMLQQLPQASHSLKNLLEEEWNFTKVITPYIRGGEAQSGKLFWSVSYMQIQCEDNKVCTYLLRLFRIYMRLSTVRLFAVILLECCSNPLENSLMSACKKVVMNSGKVQMTAPPQMRSGESILLLLLQFTS